MHHACAEAIVVAIARHGTTLIEAQLAADTCDATTCRWLFGRVPCPS